jgi:tetratricopeptide (TPR) repeat protein
MAKLSTRDVAQASLEVQREADYDALLARVEAKLPAWIAREERRVRRTVALLRRKGPHKLPAARFPRFTALKAYRELSWELRHDNPVRMLELARLALQEAEHLDVEREIGWKRSRALAALAWAEVGNALRVNDRFEEAERAFDMAFHCLGLGRTDDRLMARLHNLRASLFADRGQIALALGALDVAIDTYLRAGEPHLAGGACITKGHHLVETGQFERALDETRRGLALVDPKRDPDLHYAGFHNSARALLRAGRALEARRLLAEAPAASPSSRLLRLRHLWLEGEVAAQLGEGEEAETAFRRVRQGLREAGRRFDAAIVAIELASLRVRAGDPEESRKICLEASEELFGLGIPGEAKTAILMLLKAYQVGTATVQLIDGVAGYLRRSEVPRQAQAPGTE